MLHIQLAVAEAEVLSEADEQSARDDNRQWTDSYNTLMKLLHMYYDLLDVLGCMHVSKTTGPIRVNKPANCLHYEGNLQSEEQSCLPLVKQLRLFLHLRNLLQCVGRIHNALVSRHIVSLLPTKHRLTTLIVIATCVNQLHGGVLSLLCDNAIRSWQHVK